MLLWASVGVLLWIAIYSVIQLCIVGRYGQILLTGSRRRSDPPTCPKAAVILAIRGPDPFLENNVLALLDQDYPDYTLFLVIDHIDDPTWPAMRRLRDAMPDRVRLLILENPPTTCSLKCSALAQAVEQLDTSYQVAAFLDGDTSVHRRWLRELVAPLSDPRVGVSTGNRWYLPSDAGWGSMTRYFWNVGAVVQIWLNGFIWAGSMALRLEVLRTTGILEGWRKSLSDDATVVRQLRSHGYKVCFAPSVMMVNREKISLARFIPWAERQTIIARSWGSQWGMVVLHAANLAVCLMAPIVVATAGFLTSNALALDLALVAAAMYWSITVLSVIGLEFAMRKVLAFNNIEARWFGWSSAIRSLPSLLLAHFVVFRAVRSAYSQKKLLWRGIEYEIRDVDDFHMVSYHPFRLAEREQTTESIL
jgi:hypothetical protein